MSMRYKGGVISATPPTTSTTSAVGVWTLAQQLQAQGAGNWPTILSDQYFKYVTMLLHGDGTNGAQNNTFLDSSTNNFTITRNGNTTQGSFSPYGSNWSNYFDGSGDYLTTPTNTALDFGTGDFTVEFWLFPTTLTFNIFLSAPNNGITQIGYDGADDVRYLYFYNNSNTIRDTTSASLTLNQWNHVVLCRSGTTLSLFSNGVRRGTATYSSAISFSTCTIGRYYPGGYDTKGYISNVRMVKGTAVYNPSQTTYTVPTSPLTAISGTSLLTCQSNRFIDNSTNNFTITRDGDTSVQRFSPFSPSAAYSTSVIGGSGYFDGSGDYLTAPSNAAFSFGTGDFTVEGWVYPNAVTGGNAKVIVDLRGGSYLNSQVAVAIYNGGWLINIGGTQVISGGVAVINQWSHFALVRSGTNLKLFINGVQTGSTYSDSNNYSSYGEYIGNLAGGLAGYETVGYISDIRILKGTAVYTSAFTPPTAPLTAITNTSLLTNFTNGGIFDNAMMNNLETVGDAQISTSVKKFGTGSMAFDGTGDYLSVPATPNVTFGTGDFTIEGWIYPSSLSSNKGIFASSTERFGLIRVTNTLYWLGSPDINGNGAALTSNTWQHFAACRASGTLRLFLNGVQVGSGASTQSNAQSVWYVGSDQSNEHLDGYIDDLRITKGYARYTTTFTPPTAAFPNQ